MPVYILILFFTIIIDYIAGLMIEASTGRKRKVFLIVSIFANVGVLAVFKYYNFFVDNMNLLLHNLHITTGALSPLTILLPIGLSFHTFQAMSYTIEVYRGAVKAERHLGIYALYVMFYPQLVAGPIERPQNILHQFYEKHHFNIDRVASGLRTMLWGYFMKLVIADRLAIYVNAVYNNVSEHNGTTLLLAAIFFSFQVYCDFAGYSSIAIGCARMMGFDLMTNFKRPFFARSTGELWKRWHISLSTWFRDYVYLPLGGGRVSTSRRYFNLLFIFLLSGLWHGAAWNYVVWGGINGLYLIGGGILSQYFVFKPRPENSIADGIYSLFQITTTFALFTLALIVFRSASIPEAGLIINKIIFNRGPLFLTKDIMVVPLSLLTILFLLLVEFKWEYFPGKISFLSNNSMYIRYSVYSFFVVVILLFGIFDGGQFIYFQF